MKVLIISANILPASPSGPAYVAGAALDAGHTVEVFESLFAQDLAGELEDDADEKHPRELFDGAYYMSPELDRDYMIELIKSLGTKENCVVQVNKPYAEYGQN
jgi:hypothetical protein